MSWLTELLPPEDQARAGPAPPTCRKACGASARPARRCSTRPTWRNNLQRLPEVRPPQPHATRVSASTCCSIRKAVSRSAPKCCRSIRLKFKDSKRYPDRLMEANEATGESDALVVMQGAIKTVPVVAACFEFDFMGGSMGSVVGERFVRGVQAARRAEAALHLHHRHRRRAHAGRPVLADADGQDRRRR